MVANGVAVADFSEGWKAGSAHSAISIHARNSPLRSVTDRVLSRRDLGRKKEREGRCTSADGNHFLVGGAAVRIQPESRFDYVVRAVSITISK